MNKYLKAFSLGMQSSMEYRWNFVFGLFSSVFPLTIQYFLWTEIFKNTPSGIVYGYTYKQMLSYSIFAVLISKLISGGVEWEVLEDIKNGGLSKFIIKPIGYFQYRVSCFLGQKFFDLLFTGIIICILLFTLNVFLGFSTGIINLLIFVFSINLSLIINFMIYFSLAALAFWMNEAWGVFVVMGIVLNIISGGMFPLDIFGANIIKIFNLLPFQYTIFFSVNVLTGKLTMQAMMNGLFVQIIWIAIMLAVVRVIWNWGLKKYAAVGG